MHRPADDFKYVEPVEPVRYRYQLYISGTHLMPAHHYLPLNPLPCAILLCSDYGYPTKAFSPAGSQLGILLGARKTCWRYKVVCIEQCQRCPQRRNLSHLFSGATFQLHQVQTSGTTVYSKSKLEVMLLQGLRFLSPCHPVIRKGGPCSWFTTPPKLLKDAIL